MTALVHLWRRVCIPYSPRGKQSNVDTETSFSVFLRSKDHMACTLELCCINPAFLEHPVSPSPFALLLVQQSFIQMLEYWMGVWLQIDVMRDSGDRSLALVSHALELR